MLSRVALSTNRRLSFNMLRTGHSVRFYTAGRTEGSVAESQGFRVKEKAHEDQYILAHEKELLSKLKKDIEMKQAELEKLEEAHQMELERLEANEGKK